MPFAALLPLLPSIIGAGASIAGSVIGGGSKTSKTSSTTTPTLSPLLQGAQDATVSGLQDIFSKPDSGLGPIKQAAQDSINRGYSGLPQTATNKLAARGFGASGKVGDSVYDTEGARLGDLSGLYGQIAQLSSNRQMSAAQILAQMIHAGQGSTSSGTATSPDQGLAAGLLQGGSSLANLTSLHTLQQMLQGGGGLPSTANGGLPDNGWYSPGGGAPASGDGGFGTGFGGDGLG